MGQSYFSELVSATPTRVWVNNPTTEEIGLALAQGAVGCTTNPAFGGGLLRRAPDQVRPVVAEAVRALPGAPVSKVAELVQAKLAGRVAERFLPLFETSGGHAGFVSLQGAPAADTDGEHIWAAAEAARALGPNLVPKIPATLPGLVALDRVVESGWPVIVTEVFSLDQLEASCTRYLAVTARTGVRPPFFLAPITGILGDHLTTVASRHGTVAPDGDIGLAGVYLARRCARLVAEREYPVTLLFGGARRPQDLTGLVGAAHHATINWSTFAEILAERPPLEHTIDLAPDPVVAQRLLAAFPDFWKGWELGRLGPQDFEEFGPVLHFRASFMAGWEAVEAEIEAQRLAPV